MSMEKDLYRIKVIHSSDDYREFKEKVAKAGFRPECGTIEERDEVLTFSERFCNRKTSQVIEYECKVDDYV